MEAGIFAFRTMNLGDDMQSYAALAHVDRVQTFLDRDHLADFSGRADTAAVFNSWFLLGEDFRLPSGHINAIWHGFSAGRPQLIEGQWLDYLREQGPIGCRDLFTAELLGTAGVDTTWTGCLSLFLGQALQSRPRERSGVLFVDVPSSAEAFIPTWIVRRAVRFSTFTPASIREDPLDRLATVARLTDLLAGAELVVTRRLHVALPAASFGTPVVAIPDPAIAAARRRFAGFETLMPVAYLDDLEAGRTAIDWRSVQPVSVPPDLASRHAAFRARLGRAGVGQSVWTSSALDDIGPRTQRLRNASNGRRPERLRLRLCEWTRDLAVELWSDRSVDVSLAGFPGLSKLALEVDACPAEGAPWEHWGRLRDLVVQAEVPGLARDPAVIGRGAARTFARRVPA